MPPLTFKPRHRLSHANQFAGVYAAKVSKVRGPLVFFGLPNALPHPRLGMGVGRHVGNAVLRNRIKRLLREAFRMEQHALPASVTGKYDYVVRVRTHTPLELAEYRRLFTDAAASLDREWRKRARKAEG